jgi:hypothetical protein
LVKDNYKMKKTLNERFQELAGIKPLYTEQDQDSSTIKKVVNLKMDSYINKPVTVEYKPGSNLTAVKISWGNESHTVDFTDHVEEVEDFGNEGMDLEAIAESDDGKWQFILDVYAEATYPMTGDFAEWDFDELIIQPHPDLDDDDDDDLRLEPELNEEKPLYPGYPSFGPPPKVPPYWADGEWTPCAWEGTCGTNDLTRDDGDDFMDLRLEPELDEGSCGYTHTTQGKQLKTPGGTKGMSAYQRTKTMRS